MTGFFLRAAIVAIGLWIATLIFPGLMFSGPWALIAAAILLGVVNAIVRPLAILLTLPLTLVTLGLFLLVINAAMLGLVALLVPGLHIASFGTALGSSVVVSITSWIASGLIGPKGRIEVIVKRRER